MGWDYTLGATKQRVINDLVQPYHGTDSTTSTLAYKCIGNTLWSVCECTPNDGTPAYRYISCCLLESRRGFGWGYKAMDESMGPYYYDCPLEYLGMVPDDSKYANSHWRASVRRYQAGMERIKNLKVGDVVSLYGCSIPNVTLTKVGRSIQGTYAGKVYRVSKRVLIDMQG